ncbi:hypothetical protein H6F95_10885 [Cyanobacteria bacterium FACHB-471]|nr:hypothetical protein [Cyanobacteria bacterium FACHB-471]
MESIAFVGIVGTAILIVLFTLVVLIWFGHQFGYKVLDLFSRVKNERGILTEKEYIPSRTKIVNKRVVRNHEGFNSTVYDIPDEIQLPEKCILHIKLNEEVIVAPVSKKLYRTLEQGDSVTVWYSQGRFSKKIYFKKVRRL